MTENFVLDFKISEAIESGHHDTPEQWNTRVACLIVSQMSVTNFHPVSGRMFVIGFTRNVWSYNLILYLQLVIIFFRVAGDVFKETEVVKKWPNSWLLEDGYIFYALSF
jgi:hypothetical protein